MPYIIVKCESDKLATGITYFGDTSTEQEIVNYVKILSGGNVKDTMHTVQGFYTIDRPACWVLNTLENVGYRTRSPPTLDGRFFVWVTCKEP